MKTIDINRTLFPFASRFMNIEGHQIHYIDEGKGQPIVFVHGTPEWSFSWRELIADLRPNFRCIALDHLGMGLSDKPSENQADYSSAAHARRLKILIDNLDLKNICLVAYDFGGGMALDYAVRNVLNVSNLCLFNTWLWSLNDDPHYTQAAKVMRTWFGRWLYKSWNFPVNFIMPRAYGDRKKLTPEVHRHYKIVLPDAASRVATYAFTADLIGGGAWRDANWQLRDRLKNTPIQVFWGMKDSFVPNYELEKLEKGLPHAEVTRLPEAGHFTHEEAKAEIVAGLRKALTVSA
jgi:pimeloyl-ACP methyl ester carboxylesterase